MMPPTCSRERPTSCGTSAHGLQVDIHPGVPAVAEISGEIDIASASWLRETLLLAIRCYGPAICVDLRGVTFLDCSGVSALLATARRARLEGGRMRVTGPSAQARRVIALLGLRDVLMSADEQAEPVTAVRPEGRANVMNL
jgi:anti-anti-sigma factor